MDPSFSSKYLFRGIEGATLKRYINRIIRNITPNWRSQDETEKPYFFKILCFRDHIRHVHIRLHR